jgi:high-affinity iron transporter
MLGRILHTLIGYADQPSVMQLAAYAGTLLAMESLIQAARIFGRPGVRSLSRAS